MEHPTDELRARARQLERLTGYAGVLSQDSPAAYDPGFPARSRLIGPRRTALYEEILDHLRSQTSHLPRRGRLYLLTGGLPGSGKSTLTAEVARRQLPGHYALVDPDQIRDLILTRALDADGQHPNLRTHPDVAGLVGGPPCPRELSSLFHAEASFLADQFQRWLMRQGIDLVHDTTLRNLDGARAEIRDAHARGYEVRGYYVDVDYPTAWARSQFRWMSGLIAHDPTAEPGSSAWLGGRFLPNWFLDQSFPNGGGGPALNRITFDHVAGQGPDVERLDKAARCDGTDPRPRLVAAWRKGHPLDVERAPARPTDQYGWPDPSAPTTGRRYPDLSL